MCHQLLTVSYLVLLGAYLGLGSDVQYEGKNYVREGSPFAITCKRPPLRPPKWTKDGITLEEEDSNYEIEKESQKGNVVTMRITVGSTQLKHRGEYKCDSMSNRSHRIEVVPSAETDETWRLEATKRLRVNEPLELYCAEVDNNIVDVEWYKDGYSVSDGGRIQTSGQRRRTLTVKNATEADAGEYTCSALGSTRPYLMTEQQGHVIHVTYEARVEKFQRQIRPIFGRNFTLECKVHGYPVPRVTWFIDDEPAESFVQHHNRTIILDNAQGLPNSVFFIENVTYDDDHKVTCYAENFEGSDETSVSLAVMVSEGQHELVGVLRESFTILKSY